MAELLKALLDSNGVVIGCIVVHPDNHAGFAGELVPPDLPVTVGWKFAAGSFTPTPPPPVPITPLPEAKESKKTEICAARDAACYAPVSALGHVFQADARSQELLGGLINLGQLPGFPMPTAWRSLNDTNVPIQSLADLVQIAAAMAAQTQAAYAKSWQLKAAVDAATTNAEIEAIKW